MRLSIVLFSSAFLFSAPALADSHLIESATSAGPADISAHATVQDWDGNVLREGSNGWTCLPDDPGSEGNDPWCADAVWMGFLGAMSKGEAPSFSSVGVAYMLAGDSEVDNSVPGPCLEDAPDNCVSDPGAHLMMLIPGENSLSSYTSDFKSGGPWIMWADTPYEHLMIPLVDRTE